MESAFGTRLPARARLLARNWPTSVWFQRLSTQSRSACSLGSRGEGAEGSFSWAVSETGSKHQQINTRHARGDGLMPSVFMRERDKSRRRRSEASKNRAEGLIRLSAL